MGVVLEFRASANKPCENLVLNEDIAIALKECGPVPIEDDYTEALLYDALPHGYRDAMIADPCMKNTVGMMVMRLANSDDIADLLRAREVVKEKASDRISALGQLSLV